MRMASSSGRGPPLNECVNCIVFGWKQPKNPTMVLKTCGTCKLMKYCSQECQREHWRLVHRKHCKDLAVASTYVHDSSSCLYCTDTKNPNRSKKVCFAKMFGFEGSLKGLIILSYITGGAPDLQCKFENHYRPGLARPGRPMVQFTADLDP